MWGKAVALFRYQLNLVVRPGHRSVTYVSGCSLLLPGSDRHLGRGQLFSTATPPGRAASRNTVTVSTRSRIASAASASPAPTARPSALSSRSNCSSYRLRIAGWSATAFGAGASFCSSFGDTLSLGIQRGGLRPEYSWISVAFRYRINRSISRFNWPSCCSSVSGYFPPLCCARASLEPVLN